MSDWTDGICANEGEAGNWGYLLVVSNLAMLPVMILTARRGMWFEFTLFTIGMITSSVYHGIFAKLFWIDSPFGASLNDLDHNWGYWMIVVPLCYIARWRTTTRRIIELITFWLILIVSRAEGIFKPHLKKLNYIGDQWIPGLGKDLSVSIVLTGVLTIILVVRLMILTGYSLPKISKLWMWRYVPCCLATLAGAILSKVQGDISGCYTTLHSLWHLFIMTTLFFLFLTRDIDTKLPNSHEDDDEILIRLKGDEPLSEILVQDDPGHEEKVTIGKRD